MSYSVVPSLPVHPRRSAAAQTVLSRGRTQQDNTGWTFLIFWFAVGMFVGVALMKSSLGQTAVLQHVAKEIRSIALAR